MRKVLLRKSRGPVVTTVAKIFVDSEDPTANVILRLSSGRPVETTTSQSGVDLAQHCDRIAANFPICSETEFRSFVKDQPKAKIAEFNLPGWENAEKEVASEQA